MRIAQVAPLYESVPPRLYGGTERVVSYLTEELVRQGHDVMLFASGDSVTKARLISPRHRSIRLDEESIDHFSSHVLLLEQVFKNAADFDIIHFHIGCLHFPLSRRSFTPHLSTLHGRLDIPELVDLYTEFRDVPVVSISNYQRTPLPWLNWQGTVYHGLPLDLYSYSKKHGDYLVFLGRVSPEKRVDRVIDIAKKFGMDVKIAGKVDAVDKNYFEKNIEPRLKVQGVEFLGEIREDEKNKLLMDAYAILFPIDWPEPFGLVMIEAMACGTPVIAYRHGSVPEVVDHGVSGFIVDSYDEAVQALEKVEDLNRRMVRDVFEQRFSTLNMTQEYLNIYQRLIEGS